MASIAKDPGGRRRILFVGADGKRRTVRLGKVSQESALTVKVRIERLVAAQFTTAGLDNDTSRWVEEIEPILYDRMAAVGLLPKRAYKDGIAVATFAEQFIEQRSDVKPQTLITYRNVQRNLADYFGKTKLLTEVTAIEADRWRIYLKTTEKLSPSTVGKRVRIARMIFGNAVKHKLLRVNPFVGIKATDSANRERMHFVTRQDAQAVLDACPDTEWQLLFALSRYGGLRCPSEHLALKWADVDWERSRIRVRSEKTEGQGKAFRWVPIFPELRPYLEAADELAVRGAIYVIARYRDTNSNLRTHLNRIIDRAGIKAWPRLFQNLRASRGTELANEYPAHVAADWLGHSVKVASKHYWQTTEAHFEKAARNAAQQAGELGGMEGHPQRAIVKKAEKTVNLRAPATSKVAQAGLEPARR